MKTTAERMKEVRDRKKAKGLASVVVYVPEGMQEQVRQLAKQLTEVQQ